MRKVTAILVLLGSVFAVASSLQAGSRDWQNSTGGDWTVGSNWLQGSPPGSGDDIHFNIPVSNTVYTIPTMSLLRVTVGWEQHPGTVELVGGDLTVTDGGWGFEIGQAFTGTSGASSGDMTLTGTRVTSGTLGVGGVGGSDTGDTGTGTLTIRSGATFSVPTGGASFGWNGSANGGLSASGTVTVTGSGSSLTLGKLLDAGRNGGVGILSVTDSAAATMGSAYFGNGGVADLGGGETLGYAATGKLIVGETSSFTTTGYEVFSGWSMNRLAIGLRGGDGTAEIDGTVSTGDFYVDLPWNGSLWIGDANGIVTVGHNANIDADSLTLGAKSTMDLKLGSSGDVGDFDMTGAMTADGILKLDLLTGETLCGNYTLFTFGSRTGTFGSVYYNGSLITNPTAWNSIGGTHRLEYHDGSIQLVVPEPATTGLLLLGGLALWRRRAL